MFKQIKTLSVLLFAAASLLAVSCNKEDITPDAETPTTPAISEESIVGTWGYASSHELTGKNIVIKDNHTVTFGGMTYNWTLDGNKFTATSGNFYKLEFTINSFTKKRMSISGSTKRYNQSSDEWSVEKNLSGTVIKTVTEVLTSLPDDLLAGEWTLTGTIGTGWPLVISTDHTCVWNYWYTCNWTTNGAVFSGHGYGNYPRCRINFTVDSVTTSATMAILYVNGDFRDSVYHLQGGWQDEVTELKGMFRRDL